MSETRTLTINLDGEDYGRLLDEAARQGLPPEALAARFVSTGLEAACSEPDTERAERRRRGLAALEELAALRAELRAQGYPSVDGVELARQSREELDERSPV